MQEYIKEKLELVLGRVFLCALNVLNLHINVNVSPQVLMMFLVIKINKKQRA